MKPSHSWIYQNTANLLLSFAEITLDNEPSEIVEVIVEGDGSALIRMDGVGLENKVVIYYSVN